MKHTKTPWTVTWNMESGYNVSSDKGMPLGDMFDKANAEHIVKCVNENQELHEQVSELKDFIDEITCYIPRMFEERIQKMLNKTT